MSHEGMEGREGTGPHESVHITMPRQKNITLIGKIISIN